MPPPATLRPLRVSALALLLAALGALACLWVAWCEFPFYAWNEVRLAPAFAVRHGIDPYPPLGGGPLSTWIYGPVGMLLNLPATLSSTVTGALHTACVINALTVLAPLALIFFGSEELRARGRVTCWLAFALSVLLVPRPNLVLQVADHSAIAAGLLASWCLAQHRQPGGGRLALAAALAALAVWSKQIAVFLLPAHLVFLALGSGGATAARYFGWFAGFNLLGLGVFAGAFGFSNLWLNLVAIPGRLPWAEFVPRLSMRAWSLIAQLLLPSAALIVVWRKGLWPTRDHESGRFFQLGALAFAAMLPIGLLAYFKIGGDTNLLHSWSYLMPAALLVWCAKDGTSSGATVRLLAIVAGALALRGDDLVSLPVRPFTAHFKVASQLTANYPHAIWFPQNPLITFYAEQRLWHSEDGILTRHAADYGLREPDFRRHLPPNLSAVAYPAAVDFPFALPLLPEFDRKLEVPYWNVHTRSQP